jgi:hypothetical protein
MNAAPKLAVLRGYRRMIEPGHYCRVPAEKFQPSSFASGGDSLYSLHSPDANA